MFDQILKAEGIQAMLWLAGMFSFLVIVMAFPADLVAALVRIVTFTAITVYGYEKFGGKLQQLVTGAKGGEHGEGSDTTVLPEGEHREESDSDASPTS